MQADTRQIHGRLLEGLSQRKLMHESLASVRPDCYKQLLSPGIAYGENPSSNSDFEEQPTNRGDTNKAASLSAQAKDEAEPLCLSWENLPPDVQSVLPSDEQYMSVLQSHQKLDSGSFEGAPEFVFSAVIHINLESKESTQTWLDEMMQASLCTYRVSRGYKCQGKHVLCKPDMHCQHSEKH